MCTDRKQMPFNTVYTLHPHAFLHFCLFCRTFYFFQDIGLTWDPQKWMESFSLISWVIWWQNLAVFTKGCVRAHCCDLCFLKSQFMSMFYMQRGNRMKTKVLTTGPSLPAGPGLPGWPGRPWEQKGFMFLEEKQLTQQLTKFLILHLCIHTLTPSYQYTLWKQGCTSHQVYI